MGEDKAADPMPMQGEGDHASARKFDKEQSQFAASGKVDAAGKAAKKALEGPEGADLEAARAAAAKGESQRKPG
ncbi:MAG TPA: hypothetical protein VII73_03160 [Caulobacteraceae bacterium]